MKIEIEVNRYTLMKAATYPLAAGFFILPWFIEAYQGGKWGDFEVVTWAIVYGAFLFFWSVSWWIPLSRIREEELSKKYDEWKKLPEDQRPSLRTLVGKDHK